MRFRKLGHSEIFSMQAHNYAAFGWFELKDDLRDFVVMMRLSDD